MNLKRILFQQEDGTQLSNYEIYNFCNYLISLNYRLEFIKGLAKIINENDPQNLVLFRNKKSLKFDNMILNFGNEEACKQIKDFGEFDSFYPNEKVFELNLIYKYFNLGSKFIRNVDENFNRDWSLKKLTVSYIEKGFEESLEFVDSIFKKEIIKLGYPELLKAIDSYKDSIYEEYSLYRKKLIKFNDEESIDVKTKQQHINEILQIIGSNNFPQLLYFDFEKKHFINYSINDFFNSKDFDIKKVTHESPWMIEILTLPTTQVFLFIMGITTLVNYIKNIQKNNSDIGKNKRDKSEKYLSKIGAFLDTIKKSDSEINKILDEINGIKDEIIKSELLAIFEKLVNQFEREIKNIRLKIKVEDIKVHN
jgi:hypothetical protein